MAIVKFGSIVTEMRNKIGGQVYSRNAYGAYTKNKASPVQPNSPTQQLAKTSMTTLSASWRGLTQVQRDAWIALATQVTFTNAFGDPIKLTGFNLYMKLNRNLAAAQLLTITDAPVVPAFPSFDLVSFVVDTTAGTMVGSASPDPMTGTFYYKFWATPIVTAGKKFVKNLYRLFGASQPANGDLAPLWTARFGTFPQDGDSIWVKFGLIDSASGFESPSQIFQAIAGPVV